MRRIVLSIIATVISIVTISAQNDTMYIMKSGNIIGKFNTSEIDSIVFYPPDAVEGTLSDFDGNIYRTVTIGTQTWMAENLKTTHYADGTAIPSISGDANWAEVSVSDRAYCWYDDDSITNASIYGALYTWPAAMKGSAGSDADPSGIQGVCPDGWHLPSDSEWSTLRHYLITHGFNYDGTLTGDKIGKSLAAPTEWRFSSGTGTVGNPDYPAYQNRSGFSALPGGYRDEWGAFFYIGNEGFWWSTTEYSPLNAWFRSLAFYSLDLYRLPPACFYKDLGFSVRCMKN